MPRPRIDPQQQIYAYQLYVDSGRTLSARAIVQALEERFGRQEAARPRTVERWLAGWKTKPIEGDVPFQLDRMQEYGLPGEAGAYLLRMRVFVREGKDSFFVTGPVDQGRRPEFSFRLARWCWLLHQAAPDLCMFDLSWLANSCALRELAHDLTGHPLDIDDITDFLGYRPWIDQVHHARYMEIVGSGKEDHKKLSLKDFFDSDSVPSPEEVARLYREAVKRSNEEFAKEFAKEKAKLRNPALDLEPVQRALKKLPVGYYDNPTFRSDGMLQSVAWAEILSGSDPYELKTFVGWLPPGYLQDQEEFGALSAESLHEHIRKSLLALEAGTARRR